MKGLCKNVFAKIGSQNISLGRPGLVNKTTKYRVCV